MFENIVIKQLNADAQESASTETVEATAAIPTAPVNEAPVETAHDDFDWSIDKRNVTVYNRDEKVKYDKVYENTFVTITDGELIKGTVVGITKTDV
ncbi:MAG TPA: 30S ribosomal protein S1, partial [Chitinophagaceae bacterium]